MSGVIHYSWTETWHTSFWAPPMGCERDISIKATRFGRETQRPEAHNRKDKGQVKKKSHSLTFGMLLTVFKDKWQHIISLYSLRNRRREVQLLGEMQRLSSLQIRQFITYRNMSGQIVSLPSEHISIEQFEIFQTASVPEWGEWMLHYLEWRLLSSHWIQIGKPFTVPAIIKAWKKLVGGCWFTDISSVLPSQISNIRERVGEESSQRDKREMNVIISQLHMEYISN